MSEEWQPTPEDKRLEKLEGEGAVEFRLPAKRDSENLFEDLDLRLVVERLGAELAEVDEVHLFGSRRFQSGSTRSDIDLLICGGRLPVASVVAEVARDLDTYLDVFIDRAGRAESAVNESVITANGTAALRDALDAVPLWSRDSGWVGGTDFESVRILAGFNPPYSRAPKAEPEALVEKVDVLFVSALRVEHRAIFERFDRSEGSPRAAGSQFKLGEIDTELRPRRVAACVSERAGTISAALTTYRGIELFRPRVVVLHGITAGIEGEVSLGDVVVPDRIVEYEATKVLPEKEVDRGLRHPVHPNLIAGVKAWPKLEQFLEGLSPLRPEEGASGLSTDGMASGNKVIASTERARLIGGKGEKIVAIEMESLGVISACSRFDPAVKAIVIKAVSDFADVEKDDTWHAFASEAAAELALALVRDRII